MLNGVYVCLWRVDLLRQNHTVLSYIFALVNRQTHRTRREKKMQNLSNLAFFCECATNNQMPFKLQRNYTHVQHMQYTRIARSSFTVHSHSGRIGIYPLAERRVWSFYENRSSWCRASDKIEIEQSSRLVWPRLGENYQIYKTNQIKRQRWIRARMEDACAMTTGQKRSCEKLSLLLLLWFIWSAVSGCFPRKRNNFRWNVQK